MADGGQRLLDVIDDPNALESFLGGLTSDTELLPSAETVDNVVASLARSLDDNEYEVDSPNDTLFDTLDSSSSHLTDISRSYVPSDYGHVAVQNDSFTNNLDGFTNGNNVIRGNLSQPEHQTPNSGCDQFIGSSNSNTILNSVISAASSINNSTHVSASNLKQITASVNNCDPSKSNSFVQSGQIQFTHNSVSSASNNLNFTFSHDLQQQQHKHNVQVSAPQNQVTSLSSVSVEGQIQQNVPSNSTNNLISVVGSGIQNGVVHTLTDTTTTNNFQVVATQQQQSGHVKAQQNLLASTNLNTSANNQVTSGGTSSITNSTTNNETNASNIANNHVTLSTSTNVVGSTAALQQSQQQFIASTSNAAAVNQLVAGQTVSIPSMTVSAPQLLASSQGGLVAATAGQNILQQIQSAGASQSYIAMEQPTAALIATGPTTFGTNVALVTTGGTPTYAVLPTTPQFLTNAIIPQSHTIQTLTKTANGAYFQTAGTPQIVTTSNVNALQNVSVANATSDANGSTIVKPKQPPQLLPKPLSQVSTAVTTTNSSSLTTTPVTSVSTSVESTSGASTQQPGANTPASNSAVTDSVVTQLIQQSQQQIGGNAGAMAITPQQSFAIGNTAGIGQVVVSQVSNLSTMSAPQQAQLAGTIVVNQYGQPMLLPTASTTQAGALQLILRQQPAQPQVLTIQTPTGPATISTQAAAQAAASGKPIVRYVSQVPQVAQTSGYGLQQIQTANGPALIAVRYPQQATQANQFNQIQTEAIVNPSSTIQGQLTTGGQTQLQQLTSAQSQSVQIQIQQQQAQQMLQQTSQQQIQLQAGLNQTHLQAQQQLQVQQQTAQLQQQIQAQQQQLSLQNQQQVQNNQQGQIQNAQLQQQQQQQTAAQQQAQILQHAQISQPVLQQTVIPMETQGKVANPAQQNHFVNQPNLPSMQSTNQSQTQAQLSRDNEQQQISVPDSSSEPPPPKKAKTKSKSNKKKVTLDLEQLLKQSGIMDEDLNDDMSFDFSFAMDPPSNGLPPSPLVPPAQIPVINTTETPKKSSSKKSKSNAKKTVVQPPPPPLPPPPLPPPPVVTLSPSAKPAKKRSSPKKKNTPLPPPPPQTPPPPVFPPPPPIVTTPKSNKSKSSKKKTGGSGGLNENQKSEIPKPAPAPAPPPTPPPPPPTTTPTSSRSKKNAPPKKISSLDTLLATIEAVAAAAGASASPPRVSPPSPHVPTAPSSKPKPSPKNKGSKSKKSSTSSATTTIKTEPLLPPPPPVSNPSTIQSPAPMHPSSSNMSSLTPIPAPNLNFSQSQPINTAPNNSVLAPLNQPVAPIQTPPPSLNSMIPSPRAPGPTMTNGSSTSTSTSQTGLTRVVQTIQLTPQNQQLLRNIQSQIQKLCALPKRTESEQSALQKLVVLQQQVIATGIPVPNPAHLNNLAQSVNVDTINPATPSTTVPSDTSTTASSSSTNSPLVSLESDVNPNPVSSTVVTSAALSVLANINVSNSPKHTNSKLSSNNVSSPQIPPSTVNATASAASSSNSGAFVVGSPSVSSAASPDSTSNHTNNLTVDQCTVLPSSNVVANTAPANTTTANLAHSAAGVGNVVVSNVKADLGHLGASVSKASSEEKLKDNTHGKIPQGVTMTPSPVVPVPIATPAISNNPGPFSQQVPPVPPAPYAPPPSFTTTRSVVDEKKAEEQRLATLKAEEEKRARWKKEEFEMLLQRDQQYVVKPDYEVPFGGQKDSVERLMKYHIYRDRNDMNFEDFDTEFGNNATILLDKFSVMMSKYRTLLLKESIKEVGCAERVMLERMFVSEEKVRLEQDRILVAQGDVLELPPPPATWVPKIREMVDKEMMEFEPQDPVVSQQVQSAVDSIIGCESEDTNNYLLEEGDKVEYDAFGVPISSSGYAGLSSASSADIDEAVRSILT